MTAEYDGRLLSVEEIERIASQIRLEDGVLLTHKVREQESDFLRLCGIKKGLTIEK